MALVFIIDFSKHSTFIFVSLIFVTVISESTEPFLGTFKQILNALSFLLLEQALSIYLLHLASKSLLQLLFQKWTKQNVSMLCKGKTF